MKRCFTFIIVKYLCLSLANIYTETKHIKNVGQYFVFGR